jgi:hypothetical protein
VIGAHYTTAKIMSQIPDVGGADRRDFMQATVIVRDLETVPDLAGFAAANDLVGKSDVEVRQAIGDSATRLPMNWKRPWRERIPPRSDASLRVGNSPL